jgi:hypothetical protein
MLSAPAVLLYFNRERLDPGMASTTYLSFPNTLVTLKGLATYQQ